MYIYIYIYIPFMCATDCGNHIYFMLSGWFSSSSGLFHTRLYCCMCVSHTRGFLGACVCVYIYWSNLHVYVYIDISILIAAHFVPVMVHVPSFPFGVHIYVYHTEFTCVCVYICV